MESIGKDNNYQQQATTFENRLHTNYSNDDANPDLAKEYRIRKPKDLENSKAKKRLSITSNFEDECTELFQPESFLLIFRWKNIEKNYDNTHLIKNVSNPIGKDVNLIQIIEKFFEDVEKFKGIKTTKEYNFHSKALIILVICIICLWLTIMISSFILLKVLGLAVGAMLSSILTILIFLTADCIDLRTIETNIKKRAKNIKNIADAYNINELANTNLKLVVSKYGGWIKIIDKLSQAKLYPDVSPQKKVSKKPVNINKVFPRNEPDLAIIEHPFEEEKISPRFNYEGDNMNNSKNKEISNETSHSEVYKNRLLSSPKFDSSKKHNDLDNSPSIKGENVDLENKMDSKDNYSFGDQEKIGMHSKSPVKDFKAIQTHFSDNLNDVGKHGKNSIQEPGISEDEHVSEKVEDSLKDIGHIQLNNMKAMEGPYDYDRKDRQDTERQEF